MEATTNGGEIVFGRNTRYLFFRDIYDSYRYVNASDTQINWTGGEWVLSNAILSLVNEN